MLAAARLSPGSMVQVTVEPFGVNAVKVQSIGPFGVPEALFAACSVSQPPTNALPTTNTDANDPRRSALVDTYRISTGPFQAVQTRNRLPQQGFVVHGGSSVTVCHPAAWQLHPPSSITRSWTTPDFPILLPDPVQWRRRVRVAASHYPQTWQRGSRQTLRTGRPLAFAPADRRAKRDGSSRAHRSASFQSDPCDEWTRRGSRTPSLEG